MSGSRMIPRNDRFSGSGGYVGTGETDRGGALALLSLPFRTFSFEENSKGSCSAVSIEADFDGTRSC